MSDFIWSKKVQNDEIDEMIEVGIKISHSGWYHLEKRYGRPSRDSFYLIRNLKCCNPNSVLYDFITLFKGVTSDTYVVKKLKKQGRKHIREQKQIMNKKEALK